MEIRGVTIIEEALFSEGPYSVFVGYVDADQRRDIPHYLIINTKYKVVEASSARLFEARGICSAYAKELEQQDAALAHELDIVERIDEPDGNTDPAIKKQRKKWQTN